MAKRKVWLWLAVAGLIVGGIGSRQAACSFESGPIVIIVNISNPVQNINMTDLRKIFLSERTRWDSGKPVSTVQVSAGNPLRIVFLKIVCSMSDSDYRKYFLQAIFNGKDVNPPLEVSSIDEVKRFVASSPDAIGFIPAMYFHGDGSDGGIKAVRVDGLLASDHAYKLRM